MTNNMISPQINVLKQEISSGLIIVIIVMSPPDIGLGWELLSQTKMFGAAQPLKAATEMRARFANRTNSMNFGT